MPYISFLIKQIARVGLLVILRRAPSHVADRGTLSRYRQYWGNKHPGQT